MLMRSFAIIAGLMLSSALVSCGGGGGGGGTVVQGGLVTGHVAAMSNPEGGIGGVTVTLGARSTVTNEQGWYVFSEVSAVDRVAVRAHHTGYVETVVPIAVANGSAQHVDLLLVPEQSSGTIDASAGGTVTLTTGGQLTVAPNAFVNAAGARVSGNVSVRVAVLDPSTPQGYQAFPGDFLATRTDGSETELETFGLFAIEARQGDALLNLAAGASITVRTAIPAALAATAPASIPLWSLDPTTGRWREEGTATRAMGTAGPEYQSTIPHLSWWNYDAPWRSQTTCITVCYVDGESRPVRSIAVSAVGLDYRATTRGYTGADGCVSLNVKASARVRLDATYNGRAADSHEITTPSTITNTSQRPPMCGSVGPYSIVPMNAQIILSWGETPRDLDTHFTGPAATGRFHVYYGNRGSDAAEPFAGLDTDDTTSFGPEVVTVGRVRNGRYRYSVNNYSGQTSAPIEGSRATVTLLVPSLGVIQRFDVPTANPGNNPVWRVFDLVVNNNRIESIDAINDFAPAGDTSYSP